MRLSPCFSFIPVRVFRADRGDYMDGGFSKGLKFRNCDGIERGFVADEFMLPAAITY